MREKVQSEYCHTHICDEVSHCGPRSPRAFKSKPFQSDASFYQTMRKPHAKWTRCARTHTKSCKSAPVIGSCISKILFSFLRTCCAAAWRFLGADGVQLRGTTTTTFRGRPERRAIARLVETDNSKLQQSLQFTSFEKVCGISQSGIGFARDYNRKLQGCPYHLTALL
jgi:hypothetical protein